MRYIHMTVLFFFTTATVALSEHSSLNILEITRKDGVVVEIPIKDLEDLPQGEFRSSSPWIAEVHDFKGVALLELVRFIDPTAERVEISARDNYRVQFDIGELNEVWPLLATSMDGAPISPRTKGPFWVVFPFDDYPDLKREDLYARSIWQVQHIKIE